MSSLDRTQTYWLCSFVLFLIMYSLVSSSILRPIYAKLRMSYQSIITRIKRHSKEQEVLEIRATKRRARIRRVFSSILRPICAKLRMPYQNIITRIKRHSKEQVRSRATKRKRRAKNQNGMHVLHDPPLAAWRVERSR
jgi:hypothetical protein